nr:auxilin-related protein 2-like [Ipomoea batatas]
MKHHPHRNLSSGGVFFIGVRIAVTYAAFFIGNVVLRREIIILDIRLHVLLFHFLHPPFGLRPGGKSTPMRSDGGDHRSASARSSPFFDDREGPVFNDVFGGRPKYTNSNTNNKASTMMNDFDYDFIFKSGNDSKNNNIKTSSIFASIR